MNEILRKPASAMPIILALAAFIILAAIALLAIKKNPINDKGCSARYASNLTQFIDDTRYSYFSYKALSPIISRRIQGNIYCRQELPSRISGISLRFASRNAGRICCWRAHPCRIFGIYRHLRRCRKARHKAVLSLESALCIPPFPVSVL